MGVKLGHQMEFSREILNVLRLGDLEGGLV